MKIIYFFKSIFLGILLTLIVNSCSASDEQAQAVETDNLSSNENAIVFAKSPAFNWKNKNVEVSFEDAFQTFAPIDLISKNGEKVKYGLTDNNLKQGLTIKLKVTDSSTKAEIINEIMVERFDLEKGVNEFTIGCNENKAYIIY